VNDQEQAGKPVAKPDRTGPLSNREREVVELLAEGLSGAEIAERLVLSPETVRTHIRNAMAKLGASTRSQAVAVALRRREIGGKPEGPAGPARPASSANGAPTVSPEGLARPLVAAIDGLLSLWDVDGGWIFLAEDDGLTLRRVAERTTADAHGQPQTLALGEGALGRAALERRAQILRGTGTGGGAMIVAPMVGAGRLIGVIGLATRSSRPTGRQELLLLQAFAGRLGEVVQMGGPNVAAGVEKALAGFRASWASATRSL